MIILVKEDEVPNYERYLPLDSDSDSDPEF